LSGDIFVFEDDNSVQTFKFSNQLSRWLVNI